MKSSGLEILFRSIESSNYREVDIRINDPKMIIFWVFFLLNISFGCLKETSQGDISFRHPKHKL